MKQPIAFLPFLLALLLMGGCQYEPITEPRRFNPAAEPTLIPTSEAVARPIYTVAQGLVSEEITFSGRVSPRLETAIYPPVPGTILDTDVQSGDFIAQGDRVARFDFSTVEEEIADLESQIAEREALLTTNTATQATSLERIQIELDIAELELLAAESELTTVRTESERLQIELLERRVALVANELAATQALIDPGGVIASEINELTAMIAELQSQMENPGIFSPIDGMVLGVSALPGRRITPEQPIAMVGQMGSVDDVSIAATLRSEVLERLAENMPVSIRFQSQPDMVYEGQIVRLPYPYNTGGTDLGFDPSDRAARILPDEITILNQFALGEIVNITLLLDENPQALWLPPEAVREFSGRTFIVVREGEREQRVDVEIGLQGNGRVEVIGNVTAGQLVVGP